MAAKIKNDMLKAQAEVEESTFVGKAANGDVVIEINGRKEVTKVTIAPSLVDPKDVSFLEDLVMIAFNDVSKQVDVAMRAMMDEFLDVLKIPGLFSGEN